MHLLRIRVSFVFSRLFFRQTFRIVSMYSPRSFNRRMRALMMNAGRFLFSLFPPFVRNLRARPPTRQSVVSSAIQSSGFEERSNVHRESTHFYKQRAPPARSQFAQFWKWLDPEQITAKPLRAGTYRFFFFGSRSLTLLPRTLFLSLSSSRCRNL